ncbi:MAG: ethanolamine permease [Pseudomonadota bacterium]
MSATGELPRVLRPIHLWAIAVGLVISGDYFGWNHGVPIAGPVGMIIDTLVVTVMYVCFIFSYTELSTAIPHSGGPFAYARRALGPFGGFVAGFGTLLEFVFAPPAIALGIGDYLHFRFGVDKVTGALGAFVLFGAVNVIGVGLAATFELIVTALATLELFLYFGLTAPHLNTANILTAPLVKDGLTGLFAALPYGIWFYLGLEGVAMSAEEVVNPKKDIPKAYIAGIVTLTILALGTLICTNGVLPASEIVPVDDPEAPLPHALAKVLSPGHPMTHLMVYLGLFGLVASFHGIMMGYSRQVFALARADYLPAFLARLHPRLRTPVWAVVLPGLVGALAVLTEKGAELIALAGLGAVVVYVTSMLSLFALRKKEPELERPFRAPFYPVMPAIALALALLFLAAFAAATPLVIGVFLGLFALAFAHYQVVTRPKLARTATPAVSLVP